MSKNTLLNYFTISPAATKKPKPSDDDHVNGEATDSPKSTKKVNGLVTPTPARKKQPRSSKTNGKNDENNSPKSVKKINKTPKQSKLMNLFRAENEIPNAKRKSMKNRSPEDGKNGLGSDGSDQDTPCVVKRRRIIESSDEDLDSGEEYKPGKDEKESEDEIVESAENSSISESEDSDASMPLKRKRKSQPIKKSKASTFTPPKGNDSSFNMKDTSFAEGASWPHLNFEFLQPDNIKDAKRRSPSDPDYDPTTLYIPSTFWTNLTPAVKQWWEMKAKNFDIILFFKVGKFYELYHMDAVVAANELNLTFMRGSFAHVGFPEIAYGRFASTLVEKGYKVARVEQTETPDMMEKRCKTMSKSTKYDRVVNREICQMTSRGTQIFSVFDSASKDANSSFLLAVVETPMENFTSYYGVCFVDASIGEFHVGQFLDDRHSSRFRTLVAHYPPAQVLYEKSQLSPKTQHLFGTILSGVQKESLHLPGDFKSPLTIMLKLMEGNYFADVSLPEQLLAFVEQKEASANMTVGEDKELGIKALGAVFWYMRRFLIDHRLLSMGRFHIYEPIDALFDTNEALVVETNEKIPPKPSFKFMILDGITLKNLNVLDNSGKGSEGTLLQKLDQTCTPFGKRLLHQWICNPLAQIREITARQEAIVYLKNHHNLPVIRNLLSQLPDLERFLSRIHSEGSTGMNASHPDNKAIMFEEKTYSKRKIVDFISVLNGFRTALKIAALFQDETVADIPFLIARSCLHSSDHKYGHFPEIEENLDFFQTSFNQDEAKKEGRIIPSKGLDPEYDEAMEMLHSIEQEGKAYLKEQCDFFKCKVTFFGSDKKRFQLEIPEGACKRVTDHYELQSQRKGFRRYITGRSKNLLEKTLAAEEQKINVLTNLRERIFARFSEKLENWNVAVNCMATLDVLAALAECARNEKGSTCVPKFTHADKPFVRLVQGRYPCGMADEAFIPNDTLIACGESENASLVLVTGPNMGGKSTLMRELGLIAVMAHMGCPVPANELELSVMDRIFTRIGANDDIMSGESTFYVELCETSSILRHATKHSLVLVDELGRGTSTYDGTAIAWSVLKELCDMGCRTMFSTHYHSLVEDFKKDGKVVLGHMSCMVENEEDDNEDGSEEMVTFLYKFTGGACPKSYGFNAARLAGMPQHIIKEGRSRAKILEREVLARKLWKALDGDDLEHFCKALEAL